VNWTVVNWTVVIWTVVIWTVVIGTAIICNVDPISHFSYGELRSWFQTGANAGFRSSVETGFEGKRHNTKTISASHRNQVISESINFLTKAGFMSAEEKKAKIGE
jgi:hypothetical protein